MQSKMFADVHGRGLKKLARPAGRRSGSSEAGRKRSIVHDVNSASRLQFCSRGRTDLAPRLLLPLKKVPTIFSTQGRPIYSKLRRIDGGSRGIDPSTRTKINGIGGRVHSTSSQVVTREWGTECTCHAISPGKLRARGYLARSRE